ncbi:MAG: VTT domain-containing protein [Thermoanaerobaculia bacterium]
MSPGSSRRGAPGPWWIAAFALLVGCGTVDPQIWSESLRTLAGGQPWVLLCVLGLATLVSEDLTCVAGGLLVAEGRLELGPAIVACGVGIFLGDLALFGAGRWIGRPVLASRWVRKRVTEGALDRAARWLEHWGAWVVVATRFVPGSRLPTYVAAGVLRTSFWEFTGLFALAVVLWTPPLVWLSAVLGERALHTLESSRWRLWVVLGVAVVLVLVLRWVARLITSHEARRRLVGRLGRWRRWEFWPPWVFYPPVVAYCGWLALRHGGPTVFTAANPAIPAGGFVGESKRDLLELVGAGVEGAAPPPWTFLGGGLSLAQRMAQLERFLTTPGVAFPLVLKPDSGQRGSGVAIVRDRWAARAYLESATEDVLAQSWVDGLELGLFYVRRPGEETGRLVGVTEKVLPVVTGDGRRTVRELVLDDDRAVLLADLYLARLDGQLRRVPAAGERVPLAQLGTHCRGAVFLDGGELATEALSTTVDRLSRSLPGFHFGRYDVRVPSREAAREGRDLAVLEVNGVTSEPTHVYDPRYGALAAYRAFFWQWRTAFEIGAENRRRGVPTVGLRRLWADWRAYRRSAVTHPPEPPLPVPDGGDGVAA